MLGWLLHYHSSDVLGSILRLDLVCTGFEPRLGYLKVTYSLIGSRTIELNLNWPDHHLS